MSSSQITGYSVGQSDAHRDASRKKSRSGDIGGGANEWNEKTKAERGCKEWPEAAEGWRKEGRSARLSLTPSLPVPLFRRPLASSWPSSPGRFSTAPKRRGQ